MASTLKKTQNKQNTWGHDQAGGILVNPKYKFGIKLENVLN
jgi:hypothetical protein